MAKYGGRLLGWKAWYVGGLTFASRGDLLSIQADFLRLPAEGALAFCEFYDNGRAGIGRRMIDSGDWYFWDPKEQCIEYVPCGDWGTWKFEPRVKDCLSCVKKSGALKDEDWSNVETTLRSTRLD